MNLFCLLTGYMLVNKENIHYSRLKAVECQVLFYTLSGLSVGWLLHKEIGIRSIYYSLFPIISEHYWYISAYFIVFILSPYLNILIKQIDQKSFLRLLLIGYLAWSIIPFFTLHETTGMFFNQFVWFIVMYMTGAYIRTSKSPYNKKIFVVLFVTSNILLVTSVFVLNCASSIYESFTPYITYFRWSNSPLIIVICVSMMRLADIAPARTIRWINFLASLVLGIYLFQENIFYQEICWHDLFDNSIPSTTSDRILHLITSIISVMVIGGVVETIRIRIFKLLKIG